jgi:hypothetical protein
MRSRSRWAPAPAAVEETSDSVFELTFHLGLRAPDDVRPGHEHQVQAPARGTVETPEALSEQAPGPVAGDGVAYLATDGQPETVRRPTVREGVDHEEAPSKAPALSKHTVELKANAQALLARQPHEPSRWRTTQAASFFRPF